MLAEQGMMLTDPGHRVADRAVFCLVARPAKPEDLSAMDPCTRP